VAVKRTALILILAFAFVANGAAHLVFGAGIETYGHVGTQNGGVVAGDCYHFDVGFELWGHPGFFVDEC
jgi:hypothetical protein